MIFANGAKIMTKPNFILFRTAAYGATNMSPFQGAAGYYYDRLSKNYTSGASFSQTLCTDRLLPFITKI